MPPTPKIYTATEKDVESWGGKPLITEADLMIRRGDVVDATYDPATGVARGEICYAGHTLRTAFRLISNRMVDSQCPCAVNRVSGKICIHVVAVGLLLAKRAHSPAREEALAEERRRAERVEQSEEKKAFVNVAPKAAGGIPATMHLRLPSNWEDVFWDPEKKIECECALMIAGRAVPPDRLPAGRGIALSREDHALLSVLEDICERAPSRTVELSKPDLLNILSLCLMQSRPLACSGRDQIVFKKETVDPNVVMELDHSDGTLRIAASATLPGESAPDAAAKIVAYGNAGFVSSRGCVWRAKDILPLVYQFVYSKPQVIERGRMIAFLKDEYPGMTRLPGFSSDVDQSLFETEPMKPRFSLRVKGTLASIAVSLYALYDGAGQPFPAGTTNHFGVPDPEDLLRYGVQNPEEEKVALDRLKAMGFTGTNGGSLVPVAGARAVLNFLGANVPELRRLGWKVEITGPVGDAYDKMPSAVPVVRISSGVDFFDVEMSVQVNGAALTPSDVQAALLRGESFIRRGGSSAGGADLSKDPGDDVILLDSGSIAALRKVLTDCTNLEGSKPGSFRVSNVYAPFVHASIQPLDGVDIEEPPEWRKAAEAGNRQQKIEPVELGHKLEDVLRPYQKDGVYWLRFLEAHGLCGILADEMGLGKTLQTLAWLQLERVDEVSRGKPALIVCPTSLVENWKHECDHFTPWLKAVCVSGAKRHELWEKVPEYDLVVTSYALMRRDIAHYAGIQFSCAVLDEAQHIKNRSTQNALAAKQLRASHKLVLTGTPIENGVADLWSIMDFLMPGYLGSYEKFRADYEVPLATPDSPEAADAQVRLRRKLHPFLLRRKKVEVAKDLPQKMVKVSHCELSPDQQVVYNGVLESSRRAAKDMVKEKGFNKSRMEILALLMKLREVCCHLALLKDEKLVEKAENPSAKLEQFFEILDEAMDGGHRMLVFSQFVSMLTILREELDKRHIRYSYLDGATKDRLERCTEFNRDKGIPVFLISLKAGGTGLNLTGADMVVHFDPWWNPAVEDQATDRAHRIGQKKTVYAVKLITSGTVEEKVLELQQRKQAIIGATVEGDEQTMSKLTWNDVRAILGL